MAFLTAKQAADEYMVAVYGDVANAISSASREGGMEVTVPLKTVAHEYEEEKLTRELIPYLDSFGYYAAIYGVSLFVSWADSCILNRYVNL